MQERKSVSRSKLPGMSVYNPDGVFVGTIKDLSLELGTGEIGVIVETKYKTEIEIPWSNIGAVGDIVILKEPVEIKPPSKPPTTPKPSITPTTTVTPTEAKEAKKGVPISSLLKKIGLKREKKLCPTCGKPLTYIKQYKRWYCYNCGKYVD